MFHVIAHIYHCHFKEMSCLSLHAHLNCVFAHFTIFNESFKLVEEKETEILQVRIGELEKWELKSINPNELFYALGLVVGYETTKWLSGGWPHEWFK